MKNRGILVLVGLAVIMAFTALLRTDDPVTALLRQMERYKQLNPQEKVYLHLDQSRYTVGSNIWFSAYVVDANEAGLSKLSGVLNVELIDSQDSILEQKKLLLVNGLASGDFKLADTLPQGKYRIRAYTQLMRNAGPAYFYDQSIDIATRQAPAVVAEASRAYLGFFPEGGVMVEGIPTKIGIKSVNGSGRAAAVHGSIVDQTGRKVASFQTSPLGLGNFILKPSAGSAYVAKVDLGSGLSADFPLPAARPSGHVIRTDNLDTNQLSLKIYSSPALLTGEELKLVVQHNTDILFVFKAIAREPEIHINMDRSRLPSGIIHLSLFSGNMEPLAERLFLNRNPSAELETTLDGLKESYTSGAPLELELNSKVKGKFEAAVYSMAISNLDISAAQAETETNMLSSLLLCADLPGYIEKPNGYFVDDGKEMKAALDNLLLTQAWTRFSWADILKPIAKKSEFSAEKNLKVSGVLLSLSGKPVVRGKVSLFAPDKGSFALDTLTDAKGRFNFDNLVFEAGTRFILQATNEKGKQNVQIKLDLQADQVVTPAKNKADLALLDKESVAAYMNENAGQSSETQNRSNSIRLKEVRIKSQKKPLTQSANLNGAGVADQILHGIDMGTCINLLQCLKGRVTGYILRNDTPFLVRSPNIPMVLSLDGVLLDGARLRDLNPGEIESIEVLKTPINTSIYGMRGIGGVLVINTKKGTHNEVLRYKPWIVTHIPQGFASGRTFPEGPTPNGTLYWNPRLSTGKSGQLKLKINSKSVPGNYRIVLEGMTEKGQLGRTVYNFAVK